MLGHSYCLVILLLTYFQFLLCDDYMHIESHAINIASIQPYQIEETKKVLMQAVLETLSLSPAELKEYQQAVESLHNVQQEYFDNNGTFLVLMDNDRVVGTGAIRYVDATTCELKRMWFLKKYCGRGLGTKMAHMLLAWAKDHDYKRILLDVCHPDQQQAAVHLYKKLEFYEIAPYNTSSAKLFMEKIL